MRALLSNKIQALASYIILDVVKTELYGSEIEYEFFGEGYTLKQTFSMFLY
jgi:hypothetical protein